MIAETLPTEAPAPIRCACGKLFTPRSRRQLNCNAKCTRKYYLSVPHPCDCGQMGTHTFAGDWECDRCQRLRLQRIAEEARRRNPPRNPEDEFYALRWTRFCRDWLLAEHRRERVASWQERRYVL